MISSPDREPAMAGAYGAIILAGGRSSRMGRPKAALRLGSSTVIERMVIELRRACDNIIIVAGTRGFDQPWLPQYGARMLFDEQAFTGPVDALGRGLASAAGEICFACACDQPFVRAEVARALRLMVGEKDAAIATIGGRAQVLCAAYRRAPAIAAIARMNEQGEKRLTRIADLLDVRWVAESELMPYDSELMSFWNLNTPADYQRAVARAAAQLK